MDWRLWGWGEYYQERCISTMCIMTLHHDMSDGDTAAVDTRKGGRDAFDDDA